MKTLTLTPRADRTVALLLAIAAFVLTMCAPILATAQSIDQSDTCEVLVTKVVDGDTFYCVSTNASDEERDTVKIRVLNLDTFEKADNSFLHLRLQEQARIMNVSITRAAEIGMKASNFAKKLLLNTVVVIHRGNKKSPNKDSTPDRRLLRYVMLSDGRDFSEVMKKQGFNVKR